MVVAKPIESQGAEITQDISGQPLRNAIAADTKLPADLCRSDIYGQLFVINTEMAGSELFVENATDIGVAFGLKGDLLGADISKARLGATYTIGTNSYRGFKVNLGYRF